MPIIDPNDIAPNLEQRHRDVMLDLVLAWGSLDGALGMLLSSLQGNPFDEGAQAIGTSTNSAKLREIRKILQDTPGGADAAGVMEKHEEAYKRHSFPRNRIAHSRCAGIWTQDPRFIVFQNFEKVEENELAVYAIPIEEMQRATRWGEAMTKLALRLADALAPA